MSANLLQHIGRLHILEDDLESFLHVFRWTTLRYVPADDTYSALRRAKDMVMFDEHDKREGENDVGGGAKSCGLGAGKYASQRFQPRKSTSLYGLRRSLYASNPPNEALKRMNPDNEQVYANHIMHIYDQHMDRLKSSLWLITIIEDALVKEAWPADDKAVLDLPITCSFQNMYSQWERPKGLPRSSKRSASPMSLIPKALL